MMVAEGIIFVFCSLFVLVSVGSFLQSRKLEFGILLMHGMTKRQLNLMVFLENMMIGSSAILTGTLLGLLLGKLFLMIGAGLWALARWNFIFMARTGTDDLQLCSAVHADLVKYLCLYRE